MEEKLKGQKLADLLIQPKDHIMNVHPELKEPAWAFAEDYKKFMDEGKIEREAVDAAIVRLQAAGYEPFDFKKVYKAGDKVYWNNRNHALIAATIGQRPMNEGVRVTAAHVDSPRLDLKPTPLYEDNELAFLKTHYYGGVRRYQWGVTPLALHGVVIKKNGESVKVNIGEDAGDPLMYICDLLPHIAVEQNTRPLYDGLKGEELNVIVGSLPYIDEELPAKDTALAGKRVKLTVLNALYEKYGMTEGDFMRAELEVVPAAKAQDVGLDRSMIGAYGHDDKVCAYPALRAEIDTVDPQYTTVCVLTDKEEIGSDGATGLNSDYLAQFLETLAEGQGFNYKEVFRATVCLSADVTAAYDPTFGDNYDLHNAAFLNHGPCFAKYTGHGGKYNASDATAELAARIEDMLDTAGVCWQMNEMGKVDQGGGGTVAKYVANHNIDVIDIGVPMLSMHAPYELVAKLDVYMTYLALKAFNEN